MNNSYQWIELIMDKLFEPEDRRIDKMVSELNMANSEIKGKQLHGFMHMGKRYIPKEYELVGKALAKKPLPSLAFSLLNQANEFDTEVRKLALDRDQIKQVLYKLIYQCNNTQEIRNCLPECVVELLPNLRSMQRTITDPTYLIRNDKFAMKAYEKILPKIEMYSVMRLIY